MISGMDDDDSQSVFAYLYFCVIPGTDSGHSHLIFIYLGINISVYFVISDILFFIFILISLDLYIYLSLYDSRHRQWTFSLDLYISVSLYDSRHGQWTFSLDLYISYFYPYLNLTWSLHIFIFVWFQARTVDILTWSRGDPSEKQRVSAAAWSWSVTLTTRGTRNISSHGLSRESRYPCSCCTGGTLPT